MNRDITCMNRDITCMNRYITCMNQNITCMNRCCYPTCFYPRRDCRRILNFFMGS